MPFISIRDDSHPFLVFEPNTAPVSWNTGSLQEIKVSSQFIRITARGLHYPSYHSQYKWLYNDSKPDHPWITADCTPVPGALCGENMHSITHQSMLYFPTTVVDLPDDISLLGQPPYDDQPEYMKHVLGDNKSCSSSSCGRQITSTDTRYEVSLCDLLDNNMDIVFDASQNTLMWRFDDTKLYVYIIISILGIYLVSCLAENIRSIISQDYTGQRRSQTSWPYHGILFLTWLCLLYDVVRRTSTEFMLFEYEQTLHYILFTFVSVEAGWYATGMYVQNSKQGVKEGDNKDPNQEVKGGDNKDPNQPPTQNCTQNDQVFNSAVRCVSLITASLMLLTARVHYTFDNPYTWLMSLIFAIRSIHKFLNCITLPMFTEVEEQDTKAGEKLLWENQLWFVNNWLVEHLLHLADAFVFICILCYAVTPSYNLEVDAESTIFLILTISILSATVINIHTLNCKS